MNTASKLHVVPSTIVPSNKRRPVPANTRKRAATTSVVEQVRIAFSGKNRLATAMGFLLGGLVPLATFIVAHYEVSHARALYAQFGSYLVLGGLLYSAKTVFEWGRRAFDSTAKAVGFVLLIEGVMVTSATGWLSAVALAYLIVINGVATGCNLSARV